MSANHTTLALILIGMLKPQLGQCTAITQICADFGDYQQAINGMKLVGSTGLTLGQIYPPLHLWAPAKPLRKPNAPAKQIPAQSAPTAASTSSLRSRYNHQAGKKSLLVEVEQTPPGNYILVVDGVMRGPIVVIETATGIRGEIEFRSPCTAGKLPLDFDPRGKSIELRRNGILVTKGNAV
jgi:hypothetical protein